MPGLTPYPAYSPGMSEGSSGRPSSHLGASSASQTSVHRMSKSPRSPPPSDVQVRQEVDAGRMVVPPSYDPNWAQDSPASVAEVIPGNGSEMTGGAGHTQGGMKQQLRAEGAGQ